jgi:hypothetical protein
MIDQLEQRTNNYKWSQMRMHIRPKYTAHGESDMRHAEASVTALSNIGIYIFDRGCCSTWELFNVRAVQRESGSAWMLSTAPDTTIISILHHASHTPVVGLTPSPRMFHTRLGSWPSKGLHCLVANRHTVYESKCRLPVIIVGWYKAYPELTGFATTQ